jgi:uncharacterized protein YbjT (DUF2867 family)
VRIAVLGGTGVLGRLVVDVALGRGHEPVALSRTTGVDLVTGRGLDGALDGCAAAIDAANKFAVRRGPARAFFEATAKHLQAACDRAGVAHIVVVSIVGIDRVRAYGYYDAKLTQERHHLAGPVDATIVRATQFHEFPGQIAARSTLGGRVTLIPALRVQSVAARSVAEVLVDAAVGPSQRGRLPDVAGPGPPAELPALATAVLAHRGSRAKVLAVPLAGPLRRASREGALLPAPDATLVGPTFAAWLDGPDGPPRSAATS